jgi:hypothetical protein
MLTTRFTRGAIALSLLAGTALQAGPAWAQPGRVGSYDVAHDFRFTSPGSDTARVTAYSFQHVWLASNGQRVEDHLPQQQDPGFDPYGTDWFGANNAAYNTGLFGGAVPVQYASFQIQPQGTPGQPFCLSLSMGPSAASACNAVRVDPWVNQQPIDITGRIRSSGFADAAVLGQGAALAYAFSTAGVRIEGGVTLANGTILWQPGALVDAVGGGAGDIAVQDPVVFRALNTATGTVVEHTLVDIDMTHGGVGQVDITGPGLFIDIPEFSIDIIVDPAVIAPGQAGELHLEVDGGVLVAATGTGIYAPSVPPLGVRIPFDVPMPPIVLDYDLNLDPTQPWEVTAKMGGGGGTLADASAPCPADLAAPFGVLDLSDVNAFILGFVEMLPQSDLNSDGVWDLADVGVFIESFLAGCP